MMESHHGENITMITRGVLHEELMTNYDYEVLCLGRHPGLRNLVSELWYSVGNKLMMDYEGWLLG